MRYEAVCVNDRGVTDMRYEAVCVHDRVVMERRYEAVCANDRGVTDMRYELAYVEDGGYVAATLTGDVADGDLFAARRAMNDLLLDHDSRRLFIDSRSISRLQSGLADFEFTEQHQSELPQGTRHAVLITPEHGQHMQFVEDVAVNRMLDFRLFTDRAQAIRWLCDD